MGADLLEDLDSWLLALRAEHASPGTLHTYGASVRAFADWLGTGPASSVGRGRQPTAAGPCDCEGCAWWQADGCPAPAAADVTAPHVRAFLTHMLARCSQATANNRYRALNGFFGWLEAEEDIGASPMARIKPPRIDERLLPLLTDEQLTALLEACKGAGFAERRDAAMIRLMLEGMRRAELAGLALGQVEGDARQQQVVVVIGKGGKERIVPYGAKALLAIDRYVRARRKHAHADLPGLWLAERGRRPLGVSGVNQMLARRGRLAGLGRVHPHQLRHTSADAWLAAGGSEGDAMRIFGWSSRQMLERYGAAGRDRRAVAAHRRLAPSDRV